MFSGLILTTLGNQLAPPLEGALRELQRPSVMSHGARTEQPTRTVLRVRMSPDDFGIKPNSVAANHARKNQERSKRLFGTALASYDLVVFAMGWRGEERSERGASVTIAVYVTPSVQHAKLLCLELVTDGFSSTIWPKPALPKITGPGAELYGDEAYRLRGKSEDSIRTRVGASVISIRFSNGFPGPKQPRTPIAPEAYAEWDKYVQDVIKRVRKVHTLAR